MDIVLLAAGYGGRIRSLTDDPKCLLRIGGKSLLGRHLDIWRSLGLQKIHIVTGYKSELVEAAARKEGAGLDVSFSLNEDYQRQGNTYSLWMGVRQLDGPCLIFDADLIYEPSILENFLKDEHPDQLLVGQGKVSDIECTKVLVDEQEQVRILVDKRGITEEELQRYRFVGEATGILKFSRESTRLLSERAQGFLSREENISLNWEHLLNQFIREKDVGVHCFERGQWIEIDTPEDFEDARGMFEKA